MNTIENNNGELKITRGKFDNENRNRYYGLRVGDDVLITVRFRPEREVKAEVIEYGFMDNNQVYIRLEDGTESPWVAEQCKIITKVEDKIK